MSLPISGFKPLPFNADVDHYGCPVPTTPFTTSVDKYNWWVEKWFNSKIEAHIFIINIIYYNEVLHGNK